MRALTGGGPKGKTVEGFDDGLHGRRSHEPRRAQGRCVTEPRFPYAKRTGSRSQIGPSEGVSCPPPHRPR